MEACDGYISIGAAIGMPLVILAACVGLACVHVGVAYANKLNAKALGLTKDTK